MNFKIVMETGKNKKKHSNCSRTLFVRADSAADAFLTAKKVQGRVSLLSPISHEAYMLGVDKKYRVKS